MKLLRHGQEGKESPGILLDDGRILDASGFCSDFDEAFFANDGLANLARWVAQSGADAKEVSPNTRLGPPVARPSKIVCVGQNYREHAIEMGGEIPSEPVLFMKASSAWCGPFDPVIIPKGAQKLDYEVELAMVIGKRASSISEAEAMDHVAGYSVFCDFSERAFQKEHGGQWTKGKSADSFAPMGPYLLTKNEISDPQNLAIWTRVNGELSQNSNTREMLFGVSFIVSYISRFMTLLPGDVIATGTPSGCALGMSPPRYLQEGDVVECGIDGMGKLSKTAIAAK